MHGKNKFIEPLRETVKRIIAERNHGLGCICDDCLIFELLGAQDAKEQIPGSFLLERKADNNTPLN